MRVCVCLCARVGGWLGTVGVGVGGCMYVMYLYVAYTPYVYDACTTSHNHSCSTVTENTSDISVRLPLEMVQPTAERVAMGHSQV